MAKKFNFKIPLQGNLLYALIIAIWLLVLGIIAYRYFTAHQYHTLPESTARNVTPGLAGLSDTNDLTHHSQRSDLAAELKQESFLANLEQDTRLLNMNLQEQSLYTKLGEIYVVYDIALRNYILFVSQLPISRINNPNVIYKFSLNNEHVVIVFASDLDGDKLHYTILDLAPDSKRIVHDVGNSFPLLGADFNADKSCVFLKFAVSQKYAGSSEYQTYQYCGVDNPILLN